MARTIDWIARLDAIDLPTRWVVAIVTVAVALLIASIISQPATSAERRTITPAIVHERSISLTDLAKGTEFSVRRANGKLEVTEREGDGTTERSLVSHGSRIELGSGTQLRINAGDGHVTIMTAPSEPQNRPR